jgi:uncharacterized Zn finger protein (UPF0148 family)
MKNKFYCKGCGKETFYQVEDVKGIVVCPFCNYNNKINKSEEHFKRGKDEKRRSGDRRRDNK